MRSFSPRTTLSNKTVYFSTTCSEQVRDKGFKYVELNMGCQWLSEEIGTFLISKESDMGILQKKKHPLHSTPLHSMTDWPCELPSRQSGASQDTFNTWECCWPWKVEMTWQGTLHSFARGSMKMKNGGCQHHKARLWSSFVPLIVCSLVN